VLPLEHWGNFYLVTAAAGATLIGLLFVVITLGAERRPEDLDKVRLFLTPTVVQFGSVLLLGALMTVPEQTPFGCGVMLCALGGVGLVHCGWLATRWRAVARDRVDGWAFVSHALLPMLAYATLVVGALLLQQSERAGLVTVAAATVGMLLIAIRNSWAVAIHVAARSASRS
jgi:hypothetical protein